jgi:hypothetical protein
MRSRESWNAMRESEITAADVEREHLEDVHQGAHWAYITAVIALGMLAMLGLIAYLASQTG